MTTLRTLSSALAVVIATVAFGQRTLRLEATGTIRPALFSVAQAFERNHPGVTVSFVSTGGDILIAIEGSARQFVQDRLVLVVAADDVRVSKLAHLGLSLSVAVPGRTSAIGSQVAKTLTTAYGLYGKDWQAHVERNIKTYTNTAADSISLVKQRKADVAIVNGSAAFGSGLKVIPVPVEIADEPALSAINRSKLNRQTADEFIEYLFTRGNQQHLESRGFTSPLRPPPELTVQRPGSIMKLITSAVSSMQKETVKDRSGSALTGASLRWLLAKDIGTVTFWSADGTSLAVRVNSVKRTGGVIVPMTDGNLQVVLPQGKILRWLRRVVVAP